MPPVASLPPAEQYAPLQMPSHGGDIAYAAAEKARIRTHSHDDAVARRPRDRSAFEPQYHHHQYTDPNASFDSTLPSIRSRGRSIERYASSDSGSPNSAKRSHSHDDLMAAMAMRQRYGADVGSSPNYHDDLVASTMSANGRGGGGGIGGYSDHGVFAVEGIGLESRPPSVPPPAAKTMAADVMSITTPPPQGSTGAHASRRTASLKLTGRMLQVKLRVHYDEVAQQQFNLKPSAVVLNKQYGKKNDDIELPSCLELYDEDGDKLETKSFTGVTRGHSLLYDGSFYLVVDDSPFKYQSEQAKSPKKKKKKKSSSGPTDASTIPRVIM